MHATRAARHVEVTTGGTGVASRAGSLLLAELADRSGLTAGMSVAMAGTRRRRSRHDPGVVLTQLAVMLADGGDCLADLGVLRDQPALFGDVASDPTAWRVLASVNHDQFAGIEQAAMPRVDAGSLGSSSANFRLLMSCTRASK